MRAKRPKRRVRQACGRRETVGGRTRDGLEVAELLQDELLGDKVLQGGEERARGHIKAAQCEENLDRTDAALRSDANERTIRCAHARARLGEREASRLVGEAAEGNHGQAAVLDLSELVPLEVLLVGALQSKRRDQG